ncbi:MAG: hypothetical protein LBV72_10015, partial [Tannerella sp.]|nr:hypothetical protein [Tannerella sp.]
MTGDITIDGIEITPEGLAKLVTAVTEAISNKSSDPSQYEIANSLQGISSLPVLFESGNTFTLKRLLMSALKGTDGKEIVLQKSSDQIQWKYKDETIWTNLISVADLKGSSAFDVWQQQPGNENKTNDDYLAYLRQPATDAIEGLTELKQQVAEAGTAASEAAKTAQQAASNVKDGKTPVLGTGTSSSVTNNTPPELIFVFSGNYDGDGNPIYTFSLKVPEGKTGAIPVIKNGSITTGAPGSSVNLTFTFEDYDGQGQPIYRVDGSIPRGTPGSGSGNVVVEESTLSAGKTYLFKPNGDGAAVGVFEEYTQSDISGFVTQQEVGSAISSHNADSGAHSDIWTSLTDLQQSALTALRVKEGTGMKVTIEEDGSITLSADIDNEVFMTVTELPSTGVENKIYLVPKANAQTGDALDEYIWINGDWELVGSVSVDMSNYDTSSQVDTKISTAIEAHDEDENAHKILFDAMKAVNVSATLIPANWVQSGNRWYYNVLDSRINFECTVLFAPAHAYEDVYVDTGIHSFGVTTNGYLQIYARNE